MRSSTAAIGSIQNILTQGLYPYDIGKYAAGLLNAGEAIDPAAMNGLAGMLLRADAATSAHFGHVRSPGPPVPVGYSIFHWCLCDGEKARKWAKAKPVASQYSRTKMWTKAVTIPESTLEVMGEKIPVKAHLISPTKGGGYKIAPIPKD